MMASDPDSGFGGARRRDWNGGRARRKSQPAEGRPTSQASGERRSERIANCRDGPSRPMATGGAGATAAVIRTPDPKVPLKRVLAGDDGQDAGVSLALRDEAAPGAIDLVSPQLKTCAVGKTLARRFPAGGLALLPGNIADPRPLPFKSLVTTQLAQNDPVPTERNDGRSRAPEGRKPIRARYARVRPPVSPGLPARIGNTFPSRRFVVATPG